MGSVEKLASACVSSCKGYRYPDQESSRQSFLFVVFLFSFFPFVLFRYLPLVLSSVSVKTTATRRSLLFLLHLNARENNSNTELIRDKKALLFLYFCQPILLFHIPRNPPDTPNDPLWYPTDQ